MIGRFLDHARVRAELLLWRHGWSWLVAVLLLAVGAATHLTVIRPAEAAVEAMDAARQGLAATRAPDPVADSRADRAGNMREVIERSPAADAAARRLLELAQAQAIAMPRADYEQRAHESLPLVQLRISQPVRTTYPQLRRYIESVLRELPNASLDQVAAHRGSVEEGELEIRLHWSIWLPGVVPTQDSPKRGGG